MITSHYYSLYRIYQHAKASIHCHPKKKHKNQRLYNDKRGGISRSKRAYDLRDLPWTQKWIKCIRVTCFCGEFAPKGIGQHGANTVEFYHSLSIRNFQYLQYSQTHLGFIPMTQVKIIFSNLIKNSRKLNKKREENPAKFNQYQSQQLDALITIHNDYVNLRSLQKKLDPFCHGWCHFEEIDRTEQKWLNNFDYLQCIKRVSSLFSEDYSHLFWIIYNSPQTKYGDFDDPDFIVKDDSILRYLQISLGYRMTISEIKEFVLQEWHFGEVDGLNEDNYSDENEVESDLEIGKSLKASKYVI